MGDTVNSNNQTVNVKARIIVNFYGGLTLVTLLVISVVVLLIVAHTATVIAIIVISGIGVLSLFVFVAFKIAGMAIDLKARHRQSFIVHADNQRIVTYEKLIHPHTRKLEYMPVVHHVPTIQERHTYSHKITDIQEIDEPEEMPALPEPKKRLPDLIRYDDIRASIPKDHVLVGVSEQGIETKEKGVKGLIWIVGGSGGGKSNTTAIRVEEDYKRGHRFLGIDPHAFKDDSLTNSVRPYMDRFISPMAYQPEDILQTLDAFLAEFENRKEGSKCWPLTLLIDEVGSLTSDKPEDELDEEIQRKIKTIARVAGQETRGFGMNAIMISQDAAGLAWLRKRALMVLGHKMLMMSERQLVCNQISEIAREMDNWPIGRTVVYGIAFQGVRVLQQPLFQPPTVIDSYTMPAIRLKEQKTGLGTGGNGRERLVDTPYDGVPVVPGNVPTGTASSSKTKPEERERIIRLAKTTPRRFICSKMGKGNSFYETVKQVLDEEGL